MSALKNKAKKSLNDRAFEKVDVREELTQFERELMSLKVLYEQFFTGLLPLAPEKEHQSLMRKIRELRKAPFKNSQMNFKLRQLETRYQSFNSYWQRVLKQREEGTYARDVFKANLRDRIALEDAHAETDKGKAEKSFQSLFSSYKKALESATGKEQKIDYQNFHDKLLNRAKELKDQHGAKKVSFSIVKKNGKISVQAKVS